MLAPALACSLVLHGMVLFFGFSGEWVRTLNFSQTGEHASKRLLVELKQEFGQQVPLAQETDSKIVQGVEASVPEHLLAVQGDEQLSSGIRTKTESHAVPLPSPAAKSRFGVVEAIAGSAASMDQGSAANSDGELPGNYLPRSRLNTPPKPLQDIHIPWPPGLPSVGKNSAIFTVFVDEFGVVRKMVADGPTLMPTMEETVRQVFMNAPFAPGIANGLPVKSMLRIEVEFELDPTATELLPANSPIIVERKAL